MLIKYQNYPYITVLLFDLAISNQAQVRKALNNQAKVGLQYSTFSQLFSK
jgi:hypothetical protein